jgi:hypothetical protein
MYYIYMPLHIDIKINDQLINQFHIGRIRGGSSPDDINDYLIVDGEKPRSHSDWHVDGTPFTHRYGDGAEVCVIKGLQALGYRGE